MSSTETAGSAFVEVHARAAAGLQKEISAPVTAAVQRTQLEAERVERAAGGRRMSASHYFEERKRIVAVAEAEKAAKGVNAAAEKAVEGEKRRTGAAVGSLASRAAQVYVVAKATQFLTSAIGDYLEQGDKGLITDAAQLQAYRRTSAALEETDRKFQDLKVTLGATAADAATFGPNLQKGIRLILNPLDAAAVAMGRNTAGTRDLARQFADIDAKGGAVGETFAEIERRAIASAEATDRARVAFDKRTEATVKAVGFEFEMQGASDRVADAQKKLNDLRAGGADDARRLADAERAIGEARQAAADAAQGAIEKDRAVEEARRKLRVAQFTAGEGSQAAIDAAAELQSAEFEAKRGHEEAADAVTDVAGAERAAADVRVKSAQDVKGAQKELDDALRNSAKVAADWRAAQAEAGGATLDSKDKLALYLTELDKIPVKGPAVRTEIELIKKALESVAPTIFSPEGAAGKAAADAAAAALGGALNPAPPSSDLKLVDPGPATPTVLTAPGPAVQLTFNEKVDPMHVAAEVAWHGRI